MPQLIASDVPRQQLDALDAAAEQLPDGELRSFLRAVTHAARDGENTYLFAEQESVTTSTAAKLLGISRTHLYKVLDSGALPFHVVGNRDRRIVMSDLVQYRERMLDAQKRVAEGTAHADGVFDRALDEFD